MSKWWLAFVTTMVFIVQKLTIICGGVLWFGVYQNELCLPVHQCAGQLCETKLQRNSDKYPMQDGK
jgi:hypothetical protein